MKIIALSLNRTSTEEQITALFAAHGTVESCKLVMDKDTGESKGFGFIEMPDDAEANAAIAALHGTKFGKSKIRVKKAD
jgi:RNA recognition motif-containing protein